MMNKTLEQLHIGVLMGGYSSEREISLKSGKAVFKALQEAGCRVSPIDIVEKDEEKIRSQIREANLNVAFIALHGKLGEDGAIQSILEGLDIPYTGSSVKASQIAINKTLTQSLLKREGIPIPSYAILSKTNPPTADSIVKELGGWPVIVKPACEGSSIGISVVQKPEEWERAVELAKSFGPDVLVERYITGRELTVGILDKEALPVIEICPKRNFFDFTAKYQTGLTDYVIPASLPDPVAKKIQAMALRVHHILGCSDLSRVDFILEGESTPYVLEVNTIPGFTSTSLLPKAAQVLGLNFNQLCIKLTELAYGKKKQKSKDILV